MVFVSSKTITSLLCVLVLLSFVERIGIVVGQTVVEDWNQIGSDIDGEAICDRSGYSVAMSADGKTIAVGATNNYHGGRVYQLNETSVQYIQSGQFGPDIDDYVFCNANDDFIDYSEEFGFELAMSSDGNTIALGAPVPLNDGTGYHAGSVQLFRVNTRSSVGQYQQIGSNILGEAVYDGTGKSLAMSADGNIFVVGAPFNDENGDSSGHARVFKIDVSSPRGYKQIGPDFYGTAAGDCFGHSVAMSADGYTMAVGGIGQSTNGGYVRVYKLNVNINQYNQIGSDILGEAAGDKSGYSLALSADGSTIAVGAIWNDGNGFNAGHVRVYKINSLGQEYIQIGFDIDGEAASDYFGTSVALSSDGTTIAVGAIYNYNYWYGGRPCHIRSSAGHVRVYRLDPADGQLKQIGSDIDGESGGDKFGISLDMSSDGTMIVVGATDNEGVNGGYSGHVRVFRYSPVTLCGFFCMIWKFIGRIFGFNL